MKIRTRICLAFLLITALGFYLLVNWLVDELRPHYLQTMETCMVDTATILASHLSARVRHGEIDCRELRQALERARRRHFEARIYELTKTRIDTRVYVMDRAGKVLFDSRGIAEGQDFSRWNDVIRTLRGEYGARSTRLQSKDPRTSVLHVASPIMHQGRIVGVLTVATPAMSINLFLQNAKRKVMLAGVLAALLVMLTGFVLSTWITRPLQRLGRYALAIRDGKHPPPPRLGSGEVRELQEALEQMREAIDGRQYVEQYVQTLTHEMKAPLAAIRGGAEILQEHPPARERERFLKNIREQVERLQCLIEHLLELAALEARRRLEHQEPIAPAMIIKQAEQSLLPLLQAKRLRVRTRLETDARVRGDPFLLRQALINVLHNAIEFSPPGECIAVEVHVEARSVSLEVRDRGPGIPDYAGGRVFERFYSLERPLTGNKSSGLGLTFVREVVLLHGGTVQAGNATGGGFLVGISLPLAASPQKSG